jgi:hypothetical protein
MDNQELRKLLEQLHGEIENTDTVDEKGQELLRDLGGDIQQLLNRSEGDQLQPDPSILTSLEKTIDHLEITHPTLTLTLSKLMTILNNAGI